jgi:preprotein translocase YajC subunit
MTNPALAHLLLASTSKSTSSSSFLFLLFIVAAFGLFYFLVLKPQQRKAQAARGGQGTGIEVGDEVQTVGGVIGTVLEIHGDRYTLLTGALGQDGNLDGPQPTRIVFVRQAIARKIERIEDVAVDDDPAADVQSGTGSSHGVTDGSSEGGNGADGADADETTHGGEAEEG